MSVDRIKRVNEMIRRELSMGLYHIGQGEDVPIERISFVSVNISRDLRNASVEVSFMASESVAQSLLLWLQQHRIDFQSHIAKTVSLKYTPRLHFRETHAIEKGDRVLNILNEILPSASSDEESLEVDSSLTSHSSDEDCSHEN